MKIVKERLEPSFTDFYLKKIDTAKGYYTLNIKGNRVIVFDCGYSGSISKAMDALFNGRTVIDKIYLWETDENRIIDQRLQSSTYLIFGGNRSIYYYIFERFLSSLEGTCIGFREDDNKKYYPIIQERNINSCEQNDNSIVNNAACNCLKTFCILIRDYTSLFGDIGDIKVIEDILSIAFESDEVIDLFSNYYFEETLTSNSNSPLDMVIKGERNANYITSANSIKGFIKKTKVLAVYVSYYLKNAGLNKTIILAYRYIKKH